MGNNQTELTIVLKGDGSGLTGTIRISKDRLRDLGDTLDDTGKKAEGAGKKLDETGRSAERMGALVGAAVAAAAIGYSALVKNSIDAADNIYVTSQRLGTTTEALSTFYAAARQNGIAVNQMTTYLDQFSNASARAAGGSKVQSQLFKDMGVSVLDANGKLKSLDMLLPEVAAVFATYEDGPAKAALANKLFGEGASALIPLLNELGDKGFDKVREAAEKMGLVIDKNTAKAAHELNDQITALKLVTAGYFNDVARDVLPSLVAFTKNLADQAKAAKESGDKTTFLGNAIRDTLGFFVTIGALAQKAGVYVAYFGEQVSISWERLKASFTTDRLQAVLELLSGNIAVMPQAIAKLKASTDVIEQEFAGRSKSAEQNLKESLDSIDAAATQKITSLRANVNDLAKAGADAAAAVRTGVAPLADYARGSDDAAKKALELATAQKLQTEALSRLDTIAGQATATVDPLAAAWNRYSEAMKKIAADGGQAVAQIGKLGANSVSLAAIQDRVNKAIAAETAALGRATAAHVLHNEKLKEAPYEKLRDDISKYVANLDQEIDRVQAELDAGGELNEVQKAQLELRSKLASASESDKARLKEETDLILKKAAALEKVKAQQEQQALFDKGIDSLISGVSSSIAGGANVYDALGQSASRVLPGIASDWLKIIEKQESATDGAYDFGVAMDQLGKSVEKALPQLGQLLGTIAGGGGNGAQLGSAVGSIIGGIIGTIAGGNTALGAAIGGLIGGVIGGQGDGGGTPAVYASSRPGSLSRDGAAPLQTPLGIIATDTDNLADDAYKQFADTVKNFDIQLSKLFDPAQLDKVQTALAGFSGKFSDITALLQARFDVILGTFGENISNFVNGFATDLQGRVQALADVLALQTLEGSGDLIVDTLDEALTLINEYSLTGERVADTYNRLSVSTANYEGLLSLLHQKFDGSRIDLVRFAQDITDALGGLDRANQLWGTFLEGLYTPLELAAAKVGTTSTDAAEKLSKLGLASDTSLAQFKIAFAHALPTLTPQQVAQWIETGAAIATATNAQKAYNQALADLVEQGRGLVDKLYGGGTLENINSEIDDLQNRAERSKKPLSDLGRTITAVAEAAHRAMDLLLGDLSPLNDQQKLRVALQGLSAGTVTQEQVLEIGRRLYASSQAYVDLFQTVQSMGGRTPATGSTSQSRDPDDRFTGADQQRLDELIARRDQLEQEQREQNARDLAETVAQLAIAQKMSYAQVADELHFNLADLAKDLGLSNDELTKYIDNLRAQQTAIPDAITANADRQIDAMYDIANRPPPPHQAADHVDDGSDYGDAGTTTGQSTDGSSAVGRGGDLSLPPPPRGHNAHGGVDVDAAAAGDAQILRDVRTRLDTLIAITKSGSDSGIDATLDVVAAVRGVDRTLATRGVQARRTSVTER